MRVTGMWMVGMALGCGAAQPSGGTAEHERLAESSTAATVSEDDVSYRDHEIRVVLHQIRDDLASCVPFSTEPFPLDIMVMADGRLLRDDSMLIAQHIAACLDAALAETRMPRTVRLGRTITVDIAEAYRSP